MLSYRHAFHAGNFADVLKHVVLVEIMAHLARKEKPFDYVDTHAGAGLYDLGSAPAEKLGEYRGGIGRLWGGDWPELDRYFEAVGACNPPERLDHYPGSPMIARHFMRPGDRAWLFERHPADFVRLEALFRTDRRVRVSSRDGHRGALSVLPPLSRRGLVLIDPSYEIKSEYEQVFETVRAAYRKFSTGVYVLWYPVVDRSRVTWLQDRFSASGIRDIQQFELGMAPDDDERGMTAAGLFVINPPWGLFETLSGLLPKLAETLGGPESGFYRCVVLAPE